MLRIIVLVGGIFLLLSCSKEPPLSSHQEIAPAAKAVDYVIRTQIVPSPDQVAFAPDGGWHPFQVRINLPDLSLLCVVVNPRGLSAAPVMQSASIRPTLNYCQLLGASYDDRITVYRGNAFYLSACQSGQAVLLVETQSGVALDTVRFEIKAPAVGPFNIDVRFVDDSFTARQQAEILRAARRWETIITGDIPDISFVGDAYDEWDPFLDHWITVNDVVDDLRIFVAARDIDGRDGTLGWTWPSWTRTLSNLPIVAQIKYDTADLDSGLDQLYAVMLHEMGHALGFGAVWEDLGLLQDPQPYWDMFDPDLDWDTVVIKDTHFLGPLARAAFQAAGGNRYQGAIVPVENMPLFAINTHWREFVLDGELMDSILPLDEDINPLEPLSAITIQAFADMGYQVDLSQADSYVLPEELPPGLPAWAAKVAVKSNTAAKSFCQVRPPRYSR